MKRNLALWSGVLTGPLVWFLCLGANFALADWSCVHGSKAVLHTMSGLALAATASAGLLAWSQWRRLGRTLPGEAGGSIGSSRAMALGGIVLSAGFFVAIVALTIPQTVLGCE